MRQSAREERSSSWTRSTTSDDWCWEQTSWEGSEFLFTGYFLYNLTKNSVFYKILGLVWIHWEILTKYDNWEKCILQWLYKFVKSGKTGFFRSSLNS